MCNRLSLAMAAIAVLVIGVDWSWAASATQPASAPTPVAMTARIQAIKTACDQSSVIAAFTKAVEADPASVQAYEMYVQRMVAMGQPELACSQSQTLVQRDGDSGIGWAVVAHMSLARGDYNTALTAARRAVELLPKDAFAQRTAARALAWYNNRPRAYALSDAARTAAAMINKMPSDPTFDQAFNQAGAEYRRQLYAQTAGPKLPALSAPQITYAPAVGPPPSLPPQNVQPPVTSVNPLQYNSWLNDPFLWRNTPTQSVIIRSVSEGGGE